VIDAQVRGQNLEVVITEGDAWQLTMRREPWRLTVPLEHVRRAAVGKPLGLGLHKHVLDKGRILVCARRGAPTVEIDVDQDEFQRLTLSVPDPEATVAEIKGSLRLLGR
jgi:hypothetical protein